MLSEKQSSEPHDWVCSPAAGNGHLSHLQVWGQEGSLRHGDMDSCPLFHLRIKEGQFSGTSRLTDRLSGKDTMKHTMEWCVRTLLWRSLPATLILVMGVAEFSSKLLLIWQTHEGWQVSALALLAGQCDEYWPVSSEQSDRFTSWLRQPETLCNYPVSPSLPSSPRSPRASGHTALRWRHLLQLGSLSDLVEPNPSPPPFHIPSPHSPFSDTQHGQETLD